VILSGVRIETIVGVMALLLAAPSCKNDDKPAEPAPTPKPKPTPAPDPVDATAAAPAIAFEPVTLESADVVVTAQAPVGWTRADLSATARYWSDPHGGVFPSTVTISIDCGGDCSTVAQNIEHLGDMLVAMQKSSGYQAQITSQTAVPGGVEVELEVAKAGEDSMYQYARFVYQDGLSGGAQCMVMGVGKDAERTKETLKQACAGLTVGKK